MAKDKRLTHPVAPPLPALPEGLVAGLQNVLARQGQEQGADQLPAGTVAGLKSRAAKAIFGDMSWLDDFSNTADLSDIRGMQGQIDQLFGEVGNMDFTPRRPRGPAGWGWALRRALHPELVGSDKRRALQRKVGMMTNLVNTKTALQHLENTAVNTPERNAALEVWKESLKDRNEAALDFSLRERDIDNIASSLDMDPNIVRGLASAEELGIAGRVQTPHEAALEIEERARVLSANAVQYAGAGIDLPTIERLLPNLSENGKAAAALAIKQLDELEEEKDVARDLKEFMRGARDELNGRANQETVFVVAKDLEGNVIYDDDGQKKLLTGSRPKKSMAELLAPVLEAYAVQFGEDIPEQLSDLQEMMGLLSGKAIEARTEEDGAAILRAIKARNAEE